MSLQYFPEEYKDKYYFYDGTDSIEEMIENIERLGLDKAKCYYIKFLNQFYAVFFESFTKKVIIGKDKVFFAKNNRLIESTVGKADIGYHISERKVRKFTDTLAQELISFDNDISVYEFPTIKSTKYRQANEEILFSNYVVLLGVTFCREFYTEKDLKKLRNYFIDAGDIIAFLKRTKGAVAIDPFSQEILFQDGSLGTYTYNFRHNGYEFVPVFALQEKNKYSPFRKREWISVSRYKALYPDDFIDYEKPDFRTDKRAAETESAKSNVITVDFSKKRNM